MTKKINKGTGVLFFEAWPNRLRLLRLHQDQFFQVHVTGLNKVRVEDCCTPIPGRETYILFKSHNGVAT